MKKFSILFIALLYIPIIHTFEQRDGATIHIELKNATPNEKLFITTIKSHGKKVKSNNSDLKFMLQVVEFMHNPCLQDIRNLMTFSDTNYTNIWVHYEPVKFVGCTLCYDLYILEETSDQKEIILQKTICLFKDDSEFISSTLK